MGWKEHWGQADCSATIQELCDLGQILTFSELGFPVPERKRSVLPAYRAPDEVSAVSGLEPRVSFVRCCTGNPWRVSETVEALAIVCTVVFVCVCSYGDFPWGEFLCFHHPPSEVSRPWKKVRTTWVLSL